VWLGAVDACPPCIAPGSGDIEGWALLRASALNGTSSVSPGSATRGGVRELEGIVDLLYGASRSWKTAHLTVHEWTDSNWNRELIVPLTRRPVDPASLIAKSRFQPPGRLGSSKKSNARTCQSLETTPRSFGPVTPHTCGHPETAVHVGSEYF
jgi:hypothetical protein